VAARISGVEGCQFLRVPSVQREPCVAKAGTQNLSKNRKSDTGPSQIEEKFS